MENKLYSPKDATRLLGIHIRTLQKWDSEGKIKVIRTPSGRRKVPESEILRLQGISGSYQEGKGIAVYARVSSHDQKKHGDLDRQIGKIVDSLEGQDHSFVVITDVSSGLNDKGKGLMKLITLTDFLNHMALK